MPWRGPEVPGEVPTLGGLVADWIEAHCVIPDGSHAGAPYILTDEMARFLAMFYAVDPKTGRFLHSRGGQLVRPQKWGKGPFSAALAIAEAHHEAPVLFDGWDAQGEPVGRPWPTPWVQITAVSEDQTDNVFRALVPMIELGPLAGSVPDTGESRVNLPGGGRIEPVTASARSRLGQRVTFTVQDEALALDTPVMTATGWSVVGELAPGDRVFGRDGQPTTVIRKTDVQHGRECFRVTFADGTAVVVSDGHLWLTRLCGSSASQRVRTTGDMARDGRRFRVPLGDPLAVAGPAPPCDPYLLGLWLGDGSIGQPNICAGEQDVTDVMAALHARGINVHARECRPGVYRVHFSNSAGQQASGRPQCAKDLQAMECYRDKHIPREAMLAPTGYRVDLLRGLMDSDGHVTPDGHCTFAGNDRLSGDVLELLRGLGQTARRVFRADPRSREGGGWKVNFTPRHGLVPFALPRKAKRVTVRASRRAQWVTITAIEPVPSVPVACIEVAADDHLFRVGEASVVTHNTHSWTSENGGRRLADNQRRNLAGMGGRWLETTNAWDPSEGSVAQHTAESGEPGVHRDRTDPGSGSIFNKRERRAMMRRAYGASLLRGKHGWVDPDRIDGEIEALLGRDPAQAERFFLNRVRSEADAAFDLGKWGSLAVPSWVPPEGSVITIGVDGARFQDALAVVACHVDEGFLWPLGIWTRPEHADDDYEHPLDEVDGVMRDAFERWYPWRVYIDPQKIGGLVDTWRGRWGERRVHHWTTNRPRPMAYAIRAFRDALAGADLCHDGDDQLTQHIANARRWRTNVKDEEGRPMMLIGKDRPESPRKVDGAVACVLAWEARGDAVAADARPRRRGGLVFV